jgi:hypothetical protein
VSVIIIEGCDGTGKTRLIQRLAKDLGIPIHERASSSKEGPRQDLYEWAMRDVGTWRDQHMSLYDRHPLVSEFIYGPIVRGHIDDRFYSLESLQTCRAFAQNAMIILCDPGDDEVKHNLASETVQMDGVIENYRLILLSYRSLLHYWPGSWVRKWDYTHPEQYDAVLHRAKTHIRFWEATHND